MIRPLLLLGALTTLCNGSDDFLVKPTAAAECEDPLGCDIDGTEAVTSKGDSQTVVPLTTTLTTRQTERTGTNTVTEGNERSRRRSAGEQRPPEGVRAGEQPPPERVRAGDNSVMSASYGGYPHKREHRASGGRHEDHDDHDHGDHDDHDHGDCCPCHHAKDGGGRTTNKVTRTDDEDESSSDDDDDSRTTVQLLKGQSGGHYKHNCYRWNIEIDTQYSVAEYKNHSGVPPACRSKCRQHAKCRYWSLIGAGREEADCYLYSNVRQSMISIGRDDETLSAPRYCNRMMIPMKSFCFLEGADFYGNDIDFIENVASASRCKTQCEHHSECYYYRYSLDDKKCFLKSADAPLDLRRYHDGHIIVGPKLCHPHSLDVTRHVNDLCPEIKENWTFVADDSRCRWKSVRSMYGLKEPLACAWQCAVARWEQPFVRCAGWSWWREEQRCDLFPWRARDTLEEREMPGVVSSRACKLMEW